MAEGRSVTFRGTADFSDFNRQVDDASSNMSSSFQEAYRNMLQNAYDYSSSSKKQFEVFREEFERFRNDTLSKFERQRDESIIGFEVELESKLRSLEETRSKLNNREELRKEYGQEIGSDDPLRLSGQGFESFSRRRRGEINDTIDAERNRLIEEFEKLVERVDRPDGDIERLRNETPQSFFDSIRDTAREQIIEARAQNRSLHEVIQELERSSEIEDKLLASFLREESSNDERNRRRNRTPEEVDEERRNRRNNQIQNEVGQGQSTRSNDNSILRDVLAAGLIQKIVQAAQQIPRAKDGTELFGTAIDLLGSAGGLITQELAKGAGPLLAPILGSLTEGAIKILGESVKRSMEERENLERSINSIPLGTGRQIGFQDLSSIGVNFADYVKEEREIMRKQGGAFTQAPPRPAGIEKVESNIINNNNNTVEKFFESQTNTNNNSRIESKEKEVNNNIEKREKEINSKLEKSEREINNTFEKTDKVINNTFDKKERIISNNVEKREKEVNNNFEKREKEINNFAVNNREKIIEKLEEKNIITNDYEKQVVNNIINNVEKKEKENSIRVEKTEKEIKDTQKEINNNTVNNRIEREKQNNTIEKQIQNNNRVEREVNNNTDKIQNNVNVTNNKETKLETKERVERETNNRIDKVQSSIEKWSTQTEKEKTDRLEKVIERFTEKTNEKEINNNLEKKEREVNNNTRVERTEKQTIENKNLPFSIVPSPFIQDKEQYFLKNGRVIGNEKDENKFLTSPKFGLAEDAILKKLDKWRDDDLKSEKPDLVSNKTMENVNTTLFLEKGYGVEKSLSYELIELQRNTSKSLLSTMTMIMEKGGSTYFQGGTDYNFLNEFTGRFINLQKELLKTQTRVSDTGVFDILRNFNSIGGQWRTNDERSLQNIGAINNSLINPNNEGEKALMYALISKRNPKMDLFDIEESSQKGLNNFDYFKDKLRFYKETYGDNPEAMKFAISSGFGLDNNKAAAREIYNNIDQLLKSNISAGEFKSKFGIDDLKKGAESSTTDLQVNAAKITNEFTKGALEGLTMAATAMVEVVKQAFAGATIEMKNGNLYFDRNSTENMLKNPFAKQPRDNYYKNDISPYSLPMSANK